MSKNTGVRKKKTVLEIEEHHTRQCTCCNPGYFSRLQRKQGPVNVKIDKDREVKITDQNGKPRPAFKTAHPVDVDLISRRPRRYAYADDAHPRFFKDPLMLINLIEEERLKNENQNYGGEYPPKKSKNGRERVPEDLPPELAELACVPAGRESSKSRKKRSAAPPLPPPLAPAVASRAATNSRPPLSTGRELDSSRRKRGSKEAGSKRAGSKEDVKGKEADKARRKRSGKELNVAPDQTLPVPSASRTRRSSNARPPELNVAPDQTLPVPSASRTRRSSNSRRPRAGLTFDMNDPLISNQRAPAPAATARGGPLINPDSLAPKRGQMERRKTICEYTLGETVKPEVYEDAEQKQARKKEKKKESSKGSRGREGGSRRRKGTRTELEDLC